MVHDYGCSDGGVVVIGVVVKVGVVEVVVVVVVVVVVIVVVVLSAAVAEGGARWPEPCIVEDHRLAP